jgi:integrase
MSGTKRSTTGLGYLYEASNAFHVRYYKAETNSDGVTKLKAVSSRLCGKDAKHPSKDCKEVRDLRLQFMAQVNAEKPVEGDMLISDFWLRFIKHCEEKIGPENVPEKDKRPRLRQCTSKGYRALYRRRLQKHFGKLKLSEYRPGMGTRYLDSLTSKLGLNALKHIKALGNSIFERALIEERIKINPWRAVKLPQIKAPATKHYTPEEADRILLALKDHVNAQLAFQLACYCGLIPGEISGLKWEDGEGDVFHIQRAFVRGVLDVPKTLARIAPVVVPSQVRMYLEAWWEKCGRPTEGWIFPNRMNTQPMYMNNLAVLVVRPVLKKAGIKWHGWYACRRSCATWIIENTKGNAALAQAQMRHKSMATTLNVYKKAIRPVAHHDGILIDAFPEVKALKS